MKKVVLSVVAAIAFSPAPAFAADMPVKAIRRRRAPRRARGISHSARALMTDYIFRGVTQSGHKPSVAAYFEPRYNINDRTASSTSASPVRASSSPTTRPPKSTSTAAFARPSGRWPSISAFGNTTIRAALARAPAAIQALARAAPPRRGLQRQRRQEGCELLRSLCQGHLHLGDLAFGADLLLFAELPEHRRRRRISVRHRQVHRASDHGVCRWCSSAGTCRANSAINGSAPAMRSTAARSALRRPAYAFGIPSRTTTPGTSAWASPGRCSRSTCVTATPISTRVIARLHQRPGRQLGGTSTAINPVGSQLELVRRDLHRQAVG